MAHAEKFTLGATNGVCRHDERTEDDTVHSRKNECIDASRTHLNYAFESMRERNEYESTYKFFEKAEKLGYDISYDNNSDEEIVIHCDFKDQSAEGYIKEFGNLPNVAMSTRKDLKPLVSWVVTMPQDISSNEQGIFFEETYKFLRDRYCNKVQQAVGMSPVVSAVVHLDETTPHMHFKFIPTYYDEKSDKYRVSAKNVLNRKDLQTFHKDLTAHMEKIFGRDIGIENGATKDGNQTIQQLKYKTTLENSINGLETAYKAHQDDFDRLSKELLVEKRKALESLSELFDEVTAIKEEKEQVQKLLTNARKAVANIEKMTSNPPITEEQLRTLAQKKRFSSDYIISEKNFEKLIQQFVKLEKQAHTLAEEVKHLQENNTYYKQGYTPMLERVKQQSEHQKELKELNAYRKVFARLPKEVKEPVMKAIQTEIYGDYVKDKNIHRDKGFSR